jgi:glycosyltransferase involved in cell wall biosynthesis
VKILYLHQYFNTPSDKGGTRSYELARRLVARGHRVTIITSNRYGIKRPPSFVDGIQVEWVNVPYSINMPDQRRVVSFLRYAAAATARGLGHSVDLVFASSTPLTVAIPGIVLAKRHRCPFVFEVRDIWPEAAQATGVLKNRLLVRMAEALENAAYSEANDVVALSPTMRDHVTRAGKASERVHVIPNGYSRPSRRPTRKEGRAYLTAIIPGLGNGPLCVYLGAFGRVNGVGYAVQLAARLRSIQSPVQVVLMGDGPDYNAVVESARSLGLLGKNIFIIPPVKKAQVNDVLAASDLALSLVTNHVELWKNSANKVFEALGAGRPVAINYGGWQGELIQGAGVGILLPPDEPGEGGVIIHRALIEHPDGVLAMGKRAVGFAESQFEFDILCSSLESVFAGAVRSVNGSRERK